MAERLVHLGDGRKGYHNPILICVLIEEPTCQVVFVPTSRDENDGGSRLQTRIRYVCVPLVQISADRL